MAPEDRIKTAPVYFPTRELLTIYPNFVPIYDGHYLEFDETWRDTCRLLGAPLTRGPRLERIAEMLDPLEHAIRAKIVLDNNGRFYLRGDNGLIEMPLVAEGLRKFGMLARLIATGTLLDQGYLLWDEPEANLNPGLVARLASTIVRLSANGVQVFIATHSLFLLRELAPLLAREANDYDARFFWSTRIRERRRGRTRAHYRRYRRHPVSRRGVATVRPVSEAWGLTMPQVDIDGLSFTFPDLWIVGKYDDWAFYRTRWLRTRPESKAVDVMAMAPDRTVWLIEVEDYNHPNTEPPSALPDTVARKIFDTLAALSTEAKALRVVLPMEQWPARSRLWPQAVRLADIRQKLKQRLRPVDRYPLASGIEWPNGVLWKVARSDAMP